MPAKLRPEPQRLLEQLVEAEQRATERHMFTVYTSEGDNKVIITINHPGLPGGALPSVFQGDIDLLVHEGLLIRPRDRHLSLTSAGYTYYETIKQGSEPQQTDSGRGPSSILAFPGAQMGDMSVGDVANRDVIKINLSFGAPPEDLPRLQPEQERLLCEMVEADRNVPPEHRQKFVFGCLRGGDRIVSSVLRHPGFPSETRSQVYEGDLEELERAKLLSLSSPRERPGQRSREVSITNRGYAYYEALRSMGSDAPNS